MPLTVPMGRLINGWIIPQYPLPLDFRQQALGVGMNWRFQETFVEIFPNHGLIFIEEFPGMYCGMHSVWFARIIIQHVRNTNTIHANTDWHVLNTYLFVLNTYWYVFDTYHQYITQYMPQYMPIYRICIGMYFEAIHANTYIEKPQFEWLSVILNCPFQYGAKWQFQIVTKKSANLKDKETVNLSHGDLLPSVIIN